MIPLATNGNDTGLEDFTLGAHLTTSHVIGRSVGSEWLSLYSYMHLGCSEYWRISNVYYIDFAPYQNRNLGYGTLHFALSIRREWNAPTMPLPTLDV